MGQCAPAICHKLTPVLQPYDSKIFKDVHIFLQPSMWLVILKSHLNTLFLLISSTRNITTPVELLARVVGLPSSTWRDSTSYFSLQVAFRTISSCFYFSSVRRKVLSASSAEKMKSFSPSIRIQCSAKSAGLCFTSKKRTRNMISLQWSVQEKGILPYSCRHSLYDHRPILPSLLYVSWSNLTTLSALIPSGHHSCSNVLR